MTSATVKDIGEALGDHIRRMPAAWDGKDCVLQMKEGGDQWQQVEWPGFYFHYFIRVAVGRRFLSTPGPTIGSSSFFALGGGVPWTLRTHTLNPSNWGSWSRLHGGAPDPQEHSVILYDTAATIEAVDQYGSIGVCILCGTAVWDTTQSFRRWHNALKGEESDFEIERKKRKSLPKNRKSKFKPHGFLIFAFTAEDLEDCGSFQAGLRNKGGEVRNSKVSVNLGKYRDKYQMLSKGKK